MSMNLHELLITPGSRLPFRRELSLDRLSFPSVDSYPEPLVGEGTVVNDADVLSLVGSIRGEMLCTCDRCMTLFRQNVELPLNVPLAAELQDEENPDYFLLQGEELDLDDLLETCFILNMDTQLLCRPDCKGLCPRCGADLNNGPCSCRAEADPRLAVLEQLLDNKSID